MTIQLPLWLVLGTSVLIGLLMVLVFRYTSDQKAIGRAKDILKAHLLAVRLFQDQLPVVIGAYGKILRGTGHYLRLAFTPFLIVIVPMTALLIQMDRYLGWMPLQPARSFLLEATVSSPEVLDQVDLRLPEGLVISAPAVHIPNEKSVAWRLEANHPGQFSVDVTAGSETASKAVVVSASLERISPVRLRGNVWERMLSSAEPALPEDGTIQSISVSYPEQNIVLFGMKWNWLVLFFVVSLAAGFIFKSVLGIQI